MVKDETISKELLRLNDINASFLTFKALFNQIASIEFNAPWKNEELDKINVIINDCLEMGK